METAPITYGIEEIPEGYPVQEQASVTETQSSQPVSVTPEAMTQQAQKEESEIPEKTVQEIANSMNQVASVFNASLSFSVDKPTGKTVIKVTDRETEEVIRQIPPKELLNLIGKMRNMMGILLDVEI